MKSALLLAALAPLALLAGCNDEPAPEPTPTVAAPPTPTEPTLPAPDEATFSEVFAKACPDAENVSTSVCRSMGLGETDFACKFGLGDDEYLRHDARLTPGDGEWTLVDPETACAP